MGIPLFVLARRNTKVWVHIFREKKQVLRFFTYRIHSQVHTVVRDDGRTTWTYVGWADRIRQNKGISVFHLFCC